MNPKQELALALIRAPWKSRITDRTFILAVVAVAIGVWLFNSKAIDGQTLVGLIVATWSPWILGNNVKDAAVGSAAVKATPDTVNAGTLVAVPADVPSPSPNEGEEETQLGGLSRWAGQEYIPDPEEDAADAQMQAVLSQEAENADN